MSVRVRAILVARNGAAFLDRTVTALAAQTRRPDSLTVVDGGSSDTTAAILAAADPAQFVNGSGRASFGSLAARGLAQAPVAESDSEWLWLLSHDNAPSPTALAALLGAVEVAPSVAVAGPKLMEWDRPDHIASYGKTITGIGASIELVDGELDQAQHDRISDVLAVSGHGMLVRRSVWEALGGFDPALPSIDAALDFCIRVRLAGHRIVGVPSARVASVGGPEMFGKRSVSTRVRSRIRRAAQLHRRLTYAPAFAVPLHWLSLFPLAVGRSVAHLLTKRPGRITAEYSAAVSTAFSAGVFPARRNLARTKKLGWSAVDPLRMSWGDAREMRANRRDAAAIAAQDVAPGGALSVAHGVSHGVSHGRQLSFFSGGGAWIVVFVAAIGFVVMAPYLGAVSLAGGGLAPLSAHVGDLWSNIGYGWREVGAGFVGASDPFVVVLAVLGSLTAWAPSQAIVLSYLLALPFAALAGWWCAARFSVRAWPPAVAAILWAFSPPFLAALIGGHFGAVIAHLLLPWLVIAMLSAVRSWSAAAASGLLMAAIIACAPSLAPALVIAWLAWLLSQPRAITRLIAIPLPAVALFAPLVVQQLVRGTPLALFADPGVTTVTAVPSGWQMALLSPTDGFHGWEALLAGLSLPNMGAPVVVAALLAPLGVLAILALFLPGSRRSIPAMVLALLGFVTAVASAHLEVAFAGSVSVTVFSGAGLSLFWLGLLAAAAVALEALGTAVVVPSLVVVTATVVLVLPLIAAPLAGSATVSATSGRMLPAFVSAEAANDPLLGTLELVAQDDGSLAAVLHRGTGTTLDARSTLAATATTLTPRQERLAVLAGNLASRSGFESEAEVRELGIGFVLSPGIVTGSAATAGAGVGAGAGADADADASIAVASTDAALTAVATTDEASPVEASATRVRVREALDANASFTAIGDTAYGYLWSFDAEPGADAGAADAGAADPAAPASPAIPVPDPFATPLGTGILAGQLLILGMTLLLAIPTGARPRTRSTVAGISDPATTFEEDNSV